MRTLKALHIRGIGRGYTFVPDQSVEVEGKKKKRKKKGEPAEPAFAEEA